MMGLLGRLLAIYPVQDPLTREKRYLRDSCFLWDWAATARHAAAG
jgi:hypothetical protein